jgi:hypothetical protein
MTQTERIMSVDALKQAMSKGADAPKTNEDETQKGVADVRTPPGDRSPGTLDARWGDKPAEGHNGYPDVYGQAALQEARDGRGSLLERIFDSPKTTAPAEQALMRQNFVNAGEGTPHSPLLQRGHLPAKTAAADRPSLTDRVMRLFGRR